MNLMVPNWRCLGAAPDDRVERLRRRAARKHRSLQGELMVFVEDAAREPIPAEELQAIRESAHSLH